MQTCGWQTSISATINVGLTCRGLVQRKMADTGFISSSYTTGWCDIRLSYVWNKATTAGSMSVYWILWHFYIELIFSSENIWTWLLSFWVKAQKRNTLRILTFKIKLLAVHNRSLIPYTMRTCYILTTYNGNIMLHTVNSHVFCFLTLYNQDGEYHARRTQSPIRVV